MKIDGMFRNGIVKILIWTNTYARTGKCDLEFIKETLPKEIILIKSCNVWRCAADAKVEMMYAVFIKQQIRYSPCGHWELKRKEVTLSRVEN